MGPRANLAATLLIAGVTLLIAIAVGNAMGSRVLGLATERGPAIGATPVATPLSEASGHENAETWKREQIAAVATDPGFPDPRVTPEPPPPPPPPPVPAYTARPRPSPSPSPTPRSGVPYTSPPLPIPLVSHTPESTSEPQTASPEATVGTSTP